MDANQREYLYKQYEQGAAFIKHWHDGRHRLLTFVGTYNGAILALFGAMVTLAARDGTDPIRFTDQIVVLAFVISIVSAFVASMGLATEYATASYSVYYWQVLHDIEVKLNSESSNSEQMEQLVVQPALMRIGVATNGGRLRKEFRGREVTWLSWGVQQFFPVQHVHKFFYFFLLVLWAVTFIYLQSKAWPIVVRELQTLWT